MRFTIRDLLLVTVIVAVLLAWFLDRTMLIRRYESLLDWNPPGLDD